MCYNTYMKTCTICKKDKPLSEFGNRASSADGKTSLCKPCKRDYDNEYYRKNPDRRTYIRKNSDSRRDDNRKLMLEYLSEHPCVDCGESNPVVLEFDHRGDKKGNISNMVNNYAWVNILNEIGKCDVRCANCHRIKTARDFGWYRLADDLGV